MKKYLFLVALLIVMLPHHRADAASFYVDYSAADCSGTGTATTTPFCSLDRFTEVARSPGDIAYVRRDTATTTGTANTLTVTSIGSLQKPIVVSADYDNLWNGFSTSTQTYTIAAGTTTMVASATITGIATSTWIYAEGDCFETYNAQGLNPCMYAYEVIAVTNDKLTLSFPYKGTKSGSGFVLRNIGAAPMRGLTTTTLWQITLSSNLYTVFKGIGVNNGTSGILIQSSNNIVFQDIKFQGSASAATGGCLTSAAGAVTTNIVMRKIYCLMFGITSYFVGNGATSAQLHNIMIYDSNFIATSSTVGFVRQSPATNTTTLDVSIIDTTASLAPGSVLYTIQDNQSVFTRITTRNFKSNITGKRFASSTIAVGYIYDEDYEGVIGYNKYWNYTSPFGQTSTSTLTSTTSASFLRSGGGPVVTQVLPSQLSTTTELGRLKLFDYPIYADTSSKTYTVYFNSTSTAAWSVDPTASELWIECDMWASGNNEATSTRRIVKSISTLNFTGSTAWQSLAITCQPSQTGILYLRAWYAKTQETGKLNEFYVDGTPVVS